MCGLCGGYSTELYEYEQEFLRTLLVLNMFRGTHSTGMFDLLSGATDEKSSDANIWKTTQHPLQFAGDEYATTMKERWKAKNPSIIAMHTRLATRGSIKKDNAHPFNFYPIIGMHNGTINGKFRNSKRYDTDSEALYYNISKHGLEETLEIIKEGSPAYALVWLDYSKMTLNFFRNAARPLHYTKQSSSIYWSSEAEDILYAAKKHKRNIMQHEISAFTPGKLYTIDITSKKVEFIEKEIKVPVVRTYSQSPISSPPFTPAQRSTESRASGASSPLKWEEMGCFHRTAIFDQYDSLLGKWYTQQQIDRLKKDRLAAVSHFRQSQSSLIREARGERENVDYTHEINGRAATKGAWQLKVKDGCACCGNEADPDAPFFIYWINDNNFLCPDCQDNALSPTHFVHQQATIHMEDLEDFCTQRWDHTNNGYPDATFKRKKNVTKPANDDKPASSRVQAGEPDHATVH